MNIEYEIDKKHNILKLWWYFDGKKETFELPYDKSMTEKDILNVMDCVSNMFGG